MSELPDEFRLFAGACDAAKGTASKLKKTAVLAAYLRTLGEGDVGIAARFLAAQPFAPSSSKSLQVGGAIVVEAIRQVAGVDRQTLNEVFREQGEIGEAISPLWPDAEAGREPLRLEEVQAAFHAMAATGAQDAKRELVVSLLRRCGSREAVYVTKIILGDMRTGVSEGVIEMALAEAFGAPVAAVRGARLLVGDLDAVAELAFRNALGRAEFRPFVPLGYMLAQPIMTAEEMVAVLAGRAAIAEDKYDGIRAQLHAGPEEGGRGVRVELFSRGSGAVGYSFPDIVEPVRAFARAGGRRFVLDGEIVPMKVAAGSEPVTLPFSILQRRLRRKQLTGRHLRENPCAFVAFDLLWVDGELLLERPLAERRERLRRLVEAGSGSFTPPTAPPFVIGPWSEVTTAEALEAQFAAARARRNEGLVVKRLDSAYTPGRRGDAWLKLKGHLPTLDVVVVAAERGHGKRRDVLSDVTFAVRRPVEGVEGGFELATIGKAYTGLTDAEIAELTARFVEETIEERGRVRVLRPAVVLEVAFDQITRSERHDSGYALRFPRIARIRADKTVAEIDTLARVEEIYRSPDNLAVELEGEKRAERSGDAGQLSLF
ncbi:MAG TPA: ATP-dependent DNA ligase [Phycisphaerae bacterium]|nr:ATP-dependent DNA ligase [Phycisphaerae bacterium]